jgi:small subunit ribosomal protein S18
MDDNSYGRDGRDGGRDYGRDGRDRDGGRDGGRDSARRGRPRGCPFCNDSNLSIDYKDPGLLRYFITERGKIVPRRISGACAKHQRTITTEIKRARNIALLPFTASE